MHKHERKGVPPLNNQLAQKQKLEIIRITLAGYNAKFMTFISIYPFSCSQGWIQGGLWGQMTPLPKSYWESLKSGVVA